VFYCLVGIGVASAALSACGRKGPLEPPSAAVVTQQQTGQAAQPTQPPPKPDRPFILDRLLDRR
jgi:predicted small lipoprotein YifL